MLKIQLKGDSVKIKRDVGFRQLTVFMYMYVKPFLTALERTPTGIEPV